MGAYSSPYPMNPLHATVNYLNKVGARLRLQKARAATGRLYLVVGRDPLGNPVHIKGVQETILTGLNAIAA